MRREHELQCIIDSAFFILQDTCIVHSLPQQAQALTDITTDHGRMFEAITNPTPTPFIKIETKKGAKREFPSNIAGTDFLKGNEYGCTIFLRV